MHDRTRVTVAEHLRSWVYVLSDARHRALASELEAGLNHLSHPV